MFDFDFNLFPVTKCVPGGNGIAQIRQKLGKGKQSNQHCNKVKPGQKIIGAKVKPANANSVILTNGTDK